MADFLSDNSVKELATLTNYEMGKKGRIGQPLYLAPGSNNYKAISWEAAFKKIASQLNALNNPNEAIFYTSGRTSNEAAFLYQLFVREFGTNNLPDCSNMCHESSGIALTQTVGIGKGTVTLNDFKEAEAILVLGKNPGTNHPRMLTALQQAKKHGCIIISINPIKEAGLMNFSHPKTSEGVFGKATPIPDHYLQLKINSDMALLQAIARCWLQQEEEQPGTVLDANFLARQTEGATAYLNHSRELKFTMLSDACGIAQDEIRTVAAVLASKKKIIACWAMGLTQHKNAVNTIKEVVNLLLLKGSIGNSGAGVCPVRGHSNVQGDRTMGIQQRPPEWLLNAIEKKYQFTVPRMHGCDTVAAIEAMHEGKATVFFWVGR
jgi:molybdopterin-dependent oxidoreductase alpha subunit